MNQIPTEIDWSIVRKLLVFCTIVLCAIFVFFGFTDVLSVPIILSLFFTYLFQPAINRLNRWKVPHLLSVSGIVALVVTALTFASIEIFPFVYEQVMGIAQNVPAAVQSVNQKWIPILEGLVIDKGYMDKVAFDNIIQNFNIGSQVAHQVENAIKTIFSSAPKVLGSVVNIVFVPLMTFFLMLHIDRMKIYFKNLVPEDIRPGVRVLMKTTDETIRTVIRGQLTVALILGILYMIGFKLIDLPSALVIGLIAGVCRVVPYVDVIVGGFLSAVVLISSGADWAQVLGVVGIFALVQSMDGLFITPRVIGERVGLHPMIVIVSVVCFGSVFGFWGGLTAIPVVGLLKNVWNLALPYYCASPVYKAKHKTFRERNM